MKKKSKNLASLIVQLYRNGGTLRGIGKHLGVCAQRTVRATLLREGVVLRTLSESFRLKRLTPEQIKKRWSKMRIGLKIDFLTIISGPTFINGVCWFSCKCRCGTVKNYRGVNLRIGDTGSCGCRLKDKSFWNFRLRHGHTRRMLGKGRIRSPEYSAWLNMKNRCYRESNTGYKHYGGRGIRVCKRWLGANGAANFIKDMGPRPSSNHSLDRINTNKNYSPKNCRWATRFVQANNRRMVKKILFRGKRKTLSEWCVEFGIKYVVVKNRMKRGWSFAKSICTPYYGYNWYRGRCGEIIETRVF